MTRARDFDLRSCQRKTYKPQHDAPSEPWMDYILLPYGAFYEKTRCFLDAKKGDKMQFLDGLEVTIDSTMVVEGERMCDVLCRIRYGVKFKVAFATWMKYARLEGHGRDILVPNACIMVLYGKEEA